MSDRIERNRFRHQASTAHNWEYNFKHQFAAYFAQEIYSTSSIYTHIPKNASSTLRYSVALANGLINEQTDISWVYANNAIFCPDLKSQLSAKYTFVILRCPFSRLASAYLDQLVRRPHMYYFQLSKKGLRSMFFDKIFLPTITFESFVFKLLEYPEFLRLNAHWTPQVDFLLYQEYDNFFCVESMGSAEKILKAKIGLNIVDARDLSRHGIDKLKKVVLPAGYKVKISEISKMKSSALIVEPKCLYSDRLIDIVKTIYHEDLALYSSKFGTQNLMFSI